MTETQKKRLFEILTTYRHELIPLVVNIEVFDGLWPIEILNEIRALMNHTARIAEIENSSGDNAERERQIERELDGAFEHLKRGTLDGYKYYCISAEDVYEKFEENTREINLSYVNDGSFEIKLTQLLLEARNALKAAKEVENETIGTEIGLVIAAFEDAYQRYDKLVLHIESALSSVEHVKNVREQEIKKAVRVNRIGYIVGIIGIVVGVVGIVVNLL